MNKRNRVKLLVLCLCIGWLGFATNTFAIPMEVVESPLPGTVNVFHTAFGSPNIWQPLSYFSLNTNQANLYDPDTGLGTVYFNLYSDIDQTNPIGQVQANFNLPAANLNNSGNVAGTIDFVFALTEPNSALENYLNSLGACNGQGNCQISTQYYAYNIINNYDPNALTLNLWGADGQFQFGADIHLRLQFIPEPSSLALLASGLLGALGFIRRKNIN